MQYSIILISKRFFSVLRKALKSYTIFERPIRYGSVNLAKPEDFRMALPYLQIEGQSLKISVWLGRTCERPIRYGSVNLAKPEDFRMALPYLQIEGQSLKISVWLGRTCDRGHSLRPSAGAQSSKFRDQLLVS